MINKKIADIKFDMFIKLLERDMKTDILPDEVIFMPLTDNEWKEIFTEKRIELIRTISGKKPKSIGSLAKILNRQQEAVSRDIKHLQNLGIIKLVRRSKEKMPIIEKKILIMPIALSKEIISKK